LLEPWDPKRAVAGWVAGGLLGVAGMICDCQWIIPENSRHLAQDYQHLAIFVRKNDDEMRCLPSKGLVLQ